MRADELKAHILMEKICAPSQRSTLVMKGKPQTVRRRLAACLVAIMYIIGCEAL